MGKKHLINNYIENNNIQCAMFVETKTKKDSNTSHRNWNTLRLDGNQIHNHARGGSLIQIHPDLKMGKANPPRINNPLNECLHFTIPFLDDKLHIFLVYIHPHSRIEENIFTMSTLYKYSLIVGDFNVNNRVKKRQLNNFIQNTGFCKYVTPPTFLMQHNNDSTPDILLHTSNISNNLKVELTPDLCSDHLSLHISLDKQMPITNNRLLRYNFAKTDINKINTTMIEFINERQDQELNEEVIAQFNTKLSESFIENTPLKEIKYYTHELPPFIIQLIKRKRKMYREYRITNNPDAKMEMNRLNKNIQTLIQQFRSHKWITTCNEINRKKGKNYWSEIKKLSKYRNKGTVSSSIKVNDIIYERPEEKTEVFAKHFEKAYTETQDLNFNDNHYQVVQEWYDTFINEPAPVEDYSIDEADYFAILNQGKNTAPGHDYVTKKFVKKLDLKIHLFIIKIYEYCFKHRYLPKEWKTGTIITIPKHGTDLSKVVNYRPITLLPTLGKNFEKLIKNKIQENTGHQIPNYQFGFKTNSSTTQPLTILTNNVETSKLNGNKSVALFMDINKAFDSVWHKGLLYKLYTRGCSRHLLLLVNCFLFNRKLRVKVQNAISYEFTPEQGLPQGSPLSPLLYNIYCSDIYHDNPQHFSHQAYILQFADDTTLIAHDKSINAAMENLQNLADATSLWFNKWRLKPNPSKSHLIIFQHTPSRNSPSLNIYNQTIHAEVSTKYLGITIDNKINFNSHTANVKKNIISRAKHFRGLAYKRDGINISTMSKIYKLICRPIIEYGHVIFSNLKNPAIKNLKVAETSAIRIITKIRHPNNPLHNPPNHLLYTQTHIQPIQERLSTLTRRFCQKQHNKNSIDEYCIRRNNRISRYTHPVNSLWEIIVSLE